jgi:hypothetical protein
MQKLWLAVVVERLVLMVILAEQVVAQTVKMVIGAVIQDVHQAELLVPLTKVVDVAHKHQVVQVVQAQTTVQQVVLCKVVMVNLFTVALVAVGIMAVVALAGHQEQRQVVAGVQVM